MLVRTKNILRTLATIIILFTHIASSAQQHPLPEQLNQRLQEKLISLGNQYTPRTKHLSSEGGPKFTNRLMLESSPYLQQHAHNPVNWYSWSEEAFHAARGQNKPIFLSIGYSTCHWCHVMEEESFEHLEIAAYLNQNFISIKVDREQLPDIDNTYILAASMLSGQTGWPLNAFLTPEGAPFYASTYFPPTQFHQLIKEVSQRWSSQEVELRETGTAVLDAIQKITTNKQLSKQPIAEVSKSAVHEWVNIADEMQGGFGIAPKFPNEPTLLFLLQYSVQAQDTILLEHIRDTLNAMQQGGIFDQIGGGFHRYTIDPSWLIPHFEKMLYNQAQMLRVYLQGYQITGDPLYRRTAVTTLDYLRNVMREENGLYHSATDADSEGEEGKYFLWEKSEFSSILSPEELAIALKFYGFNEGTNFDGKNILFLPKAIPEFVVEHRYPISSFFSTLNTINKKLLKARNTRIPPHKDDKIITAWNSMVIRSLVDAYLILGDKKYLEDARYSAEALWQKHYRPDGLLRDSRSGSLGKLASLEDYAHFGIANIRLYDLTDELKWLERSITLAQEMNAIFWDESTTSFFTSRNDTLLPLRAKDRGDGAVPAASSVAFELLNHLSYRQPDQRYDIQAKQLIAALSGNIAGSPMQYSYLLKAIEERKAGTDNIQYGAQGALKAEFTKKPYGYLLSLSLKPGWHINANLPGHPKLIGSQLSADWIKEVKYPKSQQKSVSFTEQPIQLYGDNSAFVIIPSENKKLLGQLLAFTFQACSNQQCLAPETLYFSSAIQ